MAHNMLENGLFLFLEVGRCLESQRLNVDYLEANASAMCFPLSGSPGTSKRFYRCREVFTD